MPGDAYSVMPAQTDMLSRIIEYTGNVIIGSGGWDMLIPTNGTLLVLQNVTWNGKQGFQTRPDLNIVRDSLLRFYYLLHAGVSLATRAWHILGQHDKSIARSPASPTGSPNRMGRVSWKGVVKGNDEAKVDTDANLQFYSPYFYSPYPALQSIAGVVGTWGSERGLTFYEVSGAGHELPR